MISSCTEWEEEEEEEKESIFLESLLRFPLSPNDQAMPHAESQRQTLSNGACYYTGYNAHKIYCLIHYKVRKAPPAKPNKGNYM